MFSRFFLVFSFYNVERKRKNFLSTHWKTCCHYDRDRQVVLFHVDIQIVFLCCASWCPVRGRCTTVFIFVMKSLKLSNKSLRAALFFYLSKPLRQGYSGNSHYWGTSSQKKCCPCCHLYCIDKTVQRKYGVEEPVLACQNAIYDRFLFSRIEILNISSILIKSWMIYWVCEALFWTGVVDCFNLFNFFEKSLRDLLSLYTRHLLCSFFLLYMSAFLQYSSVHWKRKLSQNR